MDSTIGNQCLAAIGACLLIAMLPCAVQASGARQGVKPQPGEMVLLRDVSTRPAYRPAPPGLALIVDPTPRHELGKALGVEIGLDELSDADYAQLGSGLAEAAPRPQTTVERVAGSAVGGAMGRLSGDGGMLSGSALNQSIGGSMGAVSGATRGIGDQVRGALAQFPLGTAGGK